MQEFTNNERVISIPNEAAECGIENFEFIVGERVQVNPDDSWAMSALTFLLFKVNTNNGGFGQTIEIKISDSNCERRFDESFMIFKIHKKLKVNRRFAVSNITLKIEVVYANVKVVMREMKILNI